MRCKPCTFSSTVQVLYFDCSSLNLSTTHRIHIYHPKSNMLWQKVYHLHHFAGFLYFWNNIPGDSLGSHNTSRTSRARRCHRRVRRSDELEAFAGLELLDVLWVLFMLFREDEVLKLLGFQALKQISTWTKNISQTNRNLNRKHHIKSPKTLLQRKKQPLHRQIKKSMNYPKYNIARWSG